MVTDISLVLYILIFCFPCSEVSEFSWPVVNFKKNILKQKITNLQFFNMFKHRCHLVKRMKIKKFYRANFFLKILLKIDHFHRVKKDTLVYTKRGQYLLPWKRTEKYYVLNGSTYIALLSYFIKIYITYAVFLVYLVQKLYYSKVQKYAKNRKSRLPWKRGRRSKIYMHFCSSLNRS